jgi:hypothetical protein
MTGTFDRALAVEVEPYRGRGADTCALLDALALARYGGPHLSIHVLALVPFSITRWAYALRLLWFSAILGRPTAFPSPSTG